MYDAILEILHGVWKNGFSLTALGTAVFVLLKQRKVKKKLRRYIPWLLEDDSEVKAYIHNQRLIMERLGIEWNGLENQTTITQTSSKKSSKLSWRRKIQMSNISKGILLPLISAIALFVKQVWGYELNDEQINMYADIVLYLIMFIGLFMKPRKEKKKDEQLDFTDGPAA